MNKIKFLSLSLVALLMACFTACESKYDVDHTAHIVGTWTYIGPNYAEALVIKEDGSVLSTGVEDGEYWENVAGTIKIKGNVATMTFEDGDNAIGHIDVVPGIAFSIYEEDGEEWTFNYCAEDLSDEIVGMWVSNDGVKENMGMTIQTFTKDGKAYFTGEAQFTGPTLNIEVAYKVVGDLMFQRMLDEDREVLQNSFATRLTYASNGTSLGDIMTQITNLVEDNLEVVEYKSSWIRVKEGLNFTGKTYDYSAAYVTNAKGKDEDFTILNGTFNIDNINAGDFDVILGAGLYCVELNANSIKHKSRPYGEDVEVVTPITVDGNKVTLDFSTLYPALRKVDMYMYQSVNDSQLHMYMHTNAFINYFANLEVMSLLKYGEIDPTDAAAVEKVFTNMEARVESINVSWVFNARK